MPIQRKAHAATSPGGQSAHAAARRHFFFADFSCLHDHGPKSVLLQFTTGSYARSGPPHTCGAWTPQSRMLFGDLSGPQGPVGLKRNEGLVQQDPYGPWVPAGLAELKRPNKLNWIFTTSWRKGAQPNSPNTAAPGAPEGHCKRRRPH